jgi:hypothetical protein
MAEALKAQPKQPAQDSGYKVVKKKGKAGGRKGHFVSSRMVYSYFSKPQ